MRIVLAALRHRLQHLEQVAHRAAATDDALEAVALLELLAQPRVLGPQPALLDRTLQRVPQLVELERLGHEVGGAALDDLDGVFHGAVASDDDADDVGVAVDGGFDHARPVHARQAQIGDHDVEREIGQGLERTLGRVGLHDIEPAIHELLSYGFAERCLVLDEEQMFWRIRHLWERRYFDGISCARQADPIHARRRVQGGSLQTG